jgi:hypothetical protein
MEGTEESLVKKLLNLSGVGGCLQGRPEQKAGFLRGEVVGKTSAQLFRSILRRM